MTYTSKLLGVAFLVHGQAGSESTRKGTSNDSVVLRAVDTWHYIVLSYLDCVFLCELFLRVANVLRSGPMNRFRSRTF